MSTNHSNDACLCVFDTFAAGSALPCSGGSSDPSAMAASPRFLQRRQPRALRSGGLQTGVRLDGFRVLRLEIDAAP